MQDMGDHSARIDRVEDEVSGLRSDMVSLGNEVAGVKSDVKGLGSILGRIEQSVNKAQEKNDEKELASKPSLVALVSILITIISILVGGAWTIGSALSRGEERDTFQGKLLEQMIQSRSREVDRLQKDIDRIEDRSDASN